MVGFVLPWNEAIHTLRRPIWNERESHPRRASKREWQRLRSHRHTCLFSGRACSSLSLHGSMPVELVMHVRWVPLNATFRNFKVRLYSQNVFIYLFIGINARVGSSTVGNRSDHNINMKYIKSLIQYMICKQQLVN